MYYVVCMYVTRSVSCTKYVDECVWLVPMLNNLFIFILKRMVEKNN
jgi:hypothetical protein